MYRLHCSWNCGIAAECTLTRSLHRRKQTTHFHSARGQCMRHASVNGSTSTVSSSRLLSACAIRTVWSLQVALHGQTRLEAPLQHRYPVISRPWRGTRRGWRGTRRTMEMLGNESGSADLTNFLSANIPQFREFALACARFHGEKFFSRPQID